MILRVAESLLFEVLDSESSSIVVLLAIVFLFLAIGLNLNGGVHSGLLHRGKQKVWRFEAVFVDQRHRVGQVLARKHC